MRAARGTKLNNRKLYFTKMTKVEIPLSKTKNILMVLGATAFIVIGTLFILTPTSFLSIICRSPFIIRLSGIASVLFFGAAGIYGIIKLFDTRAGLTITDVGIIDNTNASSVGLINWSDITEIKIKEVVRTKFLLVFVKNPENYIDKVGSIKRMLLKISMKTYETPLSITCSSLKCNFSDFERLLNNELKEHSKESTE